MCSFINTFVLPTNTHEQSVGILALERTTNVARQKKRWKHNNNTNKRFKSVPATKLSEKNKYRFSRFRATSKFYFFRPAKIFEHTKAVFYLHAVFGRAQKPFCITRT